MYIKPERTYKKQGKPVVWLNPITGDYKIPPRDDLPMPSRYELQGYVRKVFDSYFEHQSWMKKVGLVNHAAEDVRNDGDILNRNRWGY